MGNQEGENLTVRNMMMEGGVVSCRKKVGVEIQCWVSCGIWHVGKLFWDAVAEMQDFDEAWRTSRAGIAGAGAGTRCGIGAASARGGDRDGGGDMMGWWCSGGVRGLVSLVVPDNGRVYVSYRGPANLPLHAFEDMDRMLLVIMLFLPTSAHWPQQLAQ